MAGAFALADAPATTASPRSQGVHSLLQATPTRPTSLTSPAVQGPTEATGALGKGSPFAVFMTPKALGAPAKVGPNTPFRTYAPSPVIGPADALTSLANGARLGGFEGPILRTQSQVRKAA